MSRIQDIILWYNKKNYNVNVAISKIVQNEKPISKLFQIKYKYKWYKKKSCNNIIIIREKKREKILIIWILTANINYIWYDIDKIK